MRGDISTEKKPRRNKLCFRTRNRPRDHFLELVFIYVMLAAKEADLVCWPTQNMGEVGNLRKNGHLITISFAPGRHESSCLEGNHAGLFNWAANRIPKRYGAGNCSLVVMQVDSAIMNMLLANGNHSLLVSQRPIPEMIRLIAIKGIDNRSDIQRAKVE